MTNDKRYWFPVKPSVRGWGWGLPVRWQGWVVFAVYFTLAIGACIYLAPRDGQAFSLFLAAITAVLIAICAWKGEPQQSRPL